MKILLIYPYVLERRIHEEDISVVPLGLYYVGALLLHHGYDVQIVNSYGLKDDKNRIKECIRSYQPDVIGVSILNANRWGGIEIARMAKEIDPAITVVFGGVGATYLWHHFLTHFDGVDYVVLEEGEYAFLELIRSIENQNRSEICKIGGVALRVGGAPKRTAKRAPIPDLDALPDPARYFSFQHVALTRGCPGNCTFCGSPDFWGRRVRTHSAEYFVNQLERLKNKGIFHFYFCDDTFTLKKELVIRVCKEIITRSLNITWVAISKVTAVDAEILAWMRKAGCTQISYGIESGSPKIRHLFGKKLNEAQIRNAFELTQQFGMLARAYFIYGAPGETESTINETISLIKKIKPLAAIFYILTLFPGTALYNGYQRRSGFDDDIWLNPIEDILYFETDSALSREMVIQFGQRLRTEFHRHLFRFAEEVDLIDSPELYPLHADFLSRLAMTFSHGDYALSETVPKSEDTAIKLYRRALAYHPEQHAYLGLGILYQKRREFSDSVRILEQGLAKFPNYQPLTICLGITLMNLGKYEDALDCFRRYPESEEAQKFAPLCREALCRR